MSPKKWLFYALIIIFNASVLYSSADKSYSFPKDHYAHSGYAVEWWYYTGHIQIENTTKEYGYELSFFKVEFTNKNELTIQEKLKTWKAKPLFIAHFAISDKANKKFYYDEKINSPIGNIAGAMAKDSYYIWNADWSVATKEDGYYLNASMKGFEIKLMLKALKPPLVHADGISRKGKEQDNYSKYYSITRLGTNGSIIIDNKEHRVSGTSWFDHEWMNNRKYFIPRWDWFSIQLSNNTEIMLYLIKDSNNKISPLSTGTIYYPLGNKESIKLKDIKITVLDYWTSEKSKAEYPIEWNLEIKTRYKGKMKLHIKPYFKNQELITSKSTKITYFEGATRVFASFDKEKLEGKGYVEMVGYTKRKHNRLSIK